MEPVSASLSAAAAAAKRALRVRVGAALRDLSAGDLERQSDAACSCALSTPQLRAAAAVALFMSMSAGEVRSDALLRAAWDRGARVFVPHVGGPSPSDMAFVRLDGADDAARLPRDRWGIPQPSVMDVLGMPRATWPPRPTRDGESAVDPGPDVIVVPCVAFDASGARLGHGKGYYGKDSSGRVRGQCGRRRNCLPVRLRDAGNSQLRSPTPRLHAHPSTPLVIIVLLVDRICSMQMLQSCARARTVTQPASVGRGSWCVAALLRVDARWRCERRPT